MKINVIWAVIWVYLVKAFAFLRTGVSWSADWAATLSGLRAVWGVVKVSYRQPSVLIIWGAIAIGGFLFGHTQEAWKWDAAAAVTKAKTDKVLAAAQAESKKAKADAAEANDKLAKLQQPPATTSVTPAPKKRMAPTPAKAWWQ